MKKALLLALISLTIAAAPLYATQSLSFSGPTSWTPGTSIVLSTTDTYSNLGGSWGLSYWLLVNPTVAPFLSITGISYFTFPNGNYTGPFPIVFDANGLETGDLGASSIPTVIPDGSYHVTDITFGLTANAPAGTYTLRTTTAAPRGSIQLTTDFNEVPIPQASFVFTVVPEPSTLALLGSGAVGAGVVACRRRRL
jgi:hypothetical protein